MVVVRLDSCKGRSRGGKPAAGGPGVVGSEGELSSGKDSTNRSGQAVCQVAAPYEIGLCKVQGVLMVADCSS